VFAQAAPLVRFPAGSGPVRIEKRVYQWERADAREDGGQAGGRITATCARRGDAGDELDLADRAHLDRPVGAIHRAALLEDGGDDVVAGVEVGEQFRQQIGPTRISLSAKSARELGGLDTDCTMVGRSDKERSVSFGLGDSGLPFGAFRFCQTCENSLLHNSDPRGLGRVD